MITTLPSVAQWLECWPEHRRVTGLIPSQGLSFGFAPQPWLGCVQEAISQCVSITSMFLSLSLPPRFYSL